MSDKLKEIHAELKSQFEDAESAQRDNREQALEDRRFCDIPGAQWEGSLGEAFENRVKMEANKVQTSITRIYNEYKNNKISIDFISKDGADAEDLADTCDMLYRADYQDSNGDEAHDNGFDEGTKGGIGAWRLRAEYEDPYDPENDFQRIVIEPIYDSDSSVYFDNGAKRQDKRDAKRCWVISGIPKDDYIEEWDDDPTSWPKDVSEADWDWTTDDVVYIAEVYVCEEQTTKIRIYADIDGEETRYNEEEFETNERLETELLAKGGEFVRERPVKRKRVHKYIMSGSKVLEDCGYIAGPNIPIIPFYGIRSYIDNIERIRGHVRMAKDAQRMANVQRSVITETAARGGEEVPIFAPKQVVKHQEMWRKHTQGDRQAFLLADPLEDAQGNMVHQGPLDYTRPPQVPASVAALIEIAEQDMQDILGNTRGREEVAVNRSGIAEEIIQDRLDMQAFIFIGNMAVSLKREAEVWLGMARELYVEVKRTMKGIDELGNTKQVKLNQPALGENGEEITKNDISKANLGLAVKVGPSSTSKKAKTIREVREMMQVTADQEMMQILSLIALLNMEGDGLSDARQFVREKLIKMGVIEPNEEERQKLAEEAANIQPDPNAELLKAAAAEAEAKGHKARADAVASLAKAEESKANAVETLAGIDRADQEQVLKAIEILQKATAAPQSGETMGTAPQ